MTDAIVVVRFIVLMVIINLVSHLPRARRRGATSECRNCSFELNADLNGSRNVPRNCLASVDIADAGGPISTILLWRQGATSSYIQEWSH
jgi:hypothetical protein